MKQDAAASLIDFEKNGGVFPVVAVDHSHRVLMVAYMNREAFEETVATGRACYYSRSRKRLWRKGEESGNFQVVREIRLDCDEDTILLIAVEQRGDGAACHVGYESDFFRMSRTANGRPSTSARRSGEVRPRLRPSEEGLRVETASVRAKFKWPTEKILSFGIPKGSLERRRSN